MENLFGFKLKSKVHGWSMWFALCNAFSLQFLPKVHGWSLWFVLCNAFSPQRLVTKCVL
ncbi:hypothetical protein Hanom_Chr12g01175021 [Helianthus anomalus]